MAGQSSAAKAPSATTLTPATMARVGTVDERFQSYNVEMVEVTGGRFWAPYGATPPNSPPATQGGAAAPAGMDPSLYEYRPPIDLSNRRLRMLAQALSPAYMRVSGTWANTTYFSDAATPPKEPPDGYGAVLTRDQWLGVIAFSNAIDAPIVTSAPIGMGTRGGPDNAWTPDQTRNWLSFTKANGGTVAAAEYFNEPTMASMGGAPEDYDAADYERDHRAFAALIRKEFPATKILAPGSVGEADADWGVASGGYGDMKVLTAAELAASTADADAFSYHHYGAVSQRCEAMGHQTSAEDALSEDWLGRTDKTLAYYRKVRDQFMPGKPFWNTETGETACGGNPWGKTFLDTFRYLDQNGRLAKQGVQVIAHNTLAASDYALLREHTYEPHPSYWGALLWRRLMGTTVLDSGVENRAGLHVYAHCLRGNPGGVAVMVLNTSTTAPASLSVPVASDRYTLTASELISGTAMLNGAQLALGPNDQLPTMAGRATPAGTLTFEPASITFLAMPDANNSACGR